MTRMRRSLSILALALVLCGCAGEGDPQSRSSAKEPRIVTVYSGRNERLIGPLIELFEEQTGIDVRVRYGSTSELTAMLLEEGEETPADAFISQDAAALGALSSAGMLKALSDELLQRVDSPFRSPKNDWVGLSGRARVVVYNTEKIASEDLPRSISETTEPRYRGRFGVAPGNASFQAHMAAYMARNGEQALAELLAGMAANKPRIYPKNAPIVEAVITGEIDWGLVNHYYLLRALAEDPDAPAGNYYMLDTDGSTFLNLAGIGLLRESLPGRLFVGFLLSDKAQRYFAKETFELALAGTDTDPETLRQATSLDSAIDFGVVSESLERTLTLIQDSGLNRFQ